MNARGPRVSTMECVLIKLAHSPVAAQLVLQDKNVKLVSSNHKTLIEKCPLKCSAH